MVGRNSEKLKSENSYPLFISCITSVRVWNIVLLGKSLFLQSPIKNVIWEKGKELKSNIPPTMTNEAGIYSFKLDEYRIAITRSPFPSFIAPISYIGTFVGKVDIWGIVVEHTYGYRSQYAYPLEINVGKCYNCRSALNSLDELLLMRHPFYGTPTRVSLLCKRCGEVSREKLIDVNLLPKLAEEYALHLNFGGL